MQGRTAEAGTLNALPFVSIAYTREGVARTSASDADALFNVAADPGSVVRFVAVGRVPVEVTASAAAGPAIVVPMRESTTELDPLTVYGEAGKKSGWWALVALAGLAILSGNR